MACVVLAYPYVRPQARLDDRPARRRSQPNSFGTGSPVRRNPKTKTNKTVSEEAVLMPATAGDVTANVRRWLNGESRR